MDKAGSDVSSSQEASLIGSMIVIINSLTLIWPIVRKVLTGKHIEYYEKLLWVLGLPHGCYMKYCGGEKRAAAAREREKQARAERRRAAGVRRQGSMAHMEDQAHASLVFVCEATASNGSRGAQYHSCDALIQVQDEPVPQQTRDLEPTAALMVFPNLFPHLSSRLDPLPPPPRRLRRGAPGTFGPTVEPQHPTPNAAGKSFPSRSHAGRGAPCFIQKH